MINIRKAKLEDVEKIYESLKQVAQKLNEPDWLSVSNHIDTYEKFIKCGYSVVACDNSKIIGCFLSEKTDIDKHDLYKMLNYNDNDINETLLVQACYVLDEYRGLGLQHKMLKKIEKMCENTNIRRYICTVHPENKFSLNNMLKSGYEIKYKTKLYGGLDRYILEKLM